MIESAIKLENRLIGFFDILGFSDALEASVEDLYKNYRTLIDAVNKTIVNPRTRPESREPILANVALHRIISDSLILVSYPIAERTSIANYLGATIHLMEEAFKLKLKLRGCIGIGDIIYDGEIILSSIFPSLYQSEKNQDWSGCFIKKNAEEPVLERVFRSVPNRVVASMPILPYSVPFKNSDIDPGGQH